MDPRLSGQKCKFSQFANDTWKQKAPPNREICPESLVAMSYYDIFVSVVPFYAPTVFVKMCIQLELSFVGTLNYFSLNKFTQRYALAQ